MKRSIRLTESDLHRVIRESVKRVINETDYSRIRPAYDKLMAAIDEFVERVKNEYDVNYDDEARDMINTLDKAAELAESFFQHPEFSPRMVWDGAPEGYNL